MGSALVGRIRELRRRPLDELLALAWDARRLNFEPVLGVSAPSPKVYRVASFTNRPGKFVNISVTGGRCALRCEHCGGRLLKDMLPVSTPARLVAVGRELRKKGCAGVLISGGSLREGLVPLLPFTGAISELRKMGLKVIAHTGLMDRATAWALREAGVMQVLIDVIGDSRTIREVYHLRKKPQDFRKALHVAREAGLGLAPHILVGLYYGKVRGEYRALEYVTEARPEAIVIISLTRIRGTAMERTGTPPPGEVAKLIAVARLLNPRTPLILGCMRQSGPEKPLLEKLAVDAGANAIAYPLEETVRHARRRGLRAVFTEECCSLMWPLLPLTGPSLS
ncbi:MAG: radical SAM protein [Thermoplasmata archaeon]